MSEANKNDSAISDELNTSELDSIVGGGGRNVGGGGTATNLGSSASKVSQNDVQNSSSGDSSTDHPVSSFNFGT